MENINKYKNCEATLKDINFKVSFRSLETDEDGKREMFNVSITNLKNNKTININNFGNSIMEYNLSQDLDHFLKNRFDYNNSFKWFLKNCKSLRGWGGYDKIESVKELETKRAYYLLYSVINDFSQYINFLEENISFDEFCSNFGYNEDSQKDYKVYEECLKYYNNICKLWLNEEQNQYFNDIVRSEDKQYSIDLKKVLK